MNTLFTPPHLIHNILLSILLMGLSALTLLSCSEDSLTGSQDMQPPSTSGNVMTTAELDGSLLFNSQTHSEKDPQQNHKNFMEMLSTVESMQKEEIEDLTDEQLLELGKPVLDITENTVQLPQKLLLAINNQLSALNLNMRELNEAQLESIKRRYQMALRENPNERPEIRKIKAKDIRQMLLDYYGSVHADNLTVSALASPPTTMCQSMFNQIGNSVYLYPGDNLNTANFVCPPSSLFYLTSGTYYNQSIQNPGNGSLWAGQGVNTKLNGNGNAQSSFYGDIKNVSIQYFTIENYIENGIYSGEINETYNIEVANVIFKNIAPDSTPVKSEDDPYRETGGEFNGAVNLYKCNDVVVRDSYFHNVSSGVLFTDCDGPLQVINNEALNPGRNFFQCDNCEGSGIKVNRNSMEHAYGYGNTILEDFINISNSRGINKDDPIQVNYNRARTDGSRIDVGKNGSFIILGDSGGQFQQAIGNIGVTPGQVGIGVAGGYDILVKNNRMFGEAWDHANVAFYSQNFSSGECGRHSFEENTANWYPEKRHSDESCSTVQNDMDVDEDTSMDETIWNLW